MAIRIGTNIASLAAQRRLSESTASVSKSFERLSSGLRINSASDDPAGLSVALKLRSDQRLYSQAIRNINDGMSLFSIAEGALSEISNIVIRQKELAEQAANGVYSSAQRRAMDTEAQQLSQEYTRIVQTVEFNGVSLFGDGPKRIALQVGTNSTDYLEFELGRELGHKVGDGTFEDAVWYATPWTVRPIAVSDMNGDGYLDVVSGTTANTRVCVYLGNGDGTIEAGFSNVSYGASVGVSIGDLNEDGKQDVVVAQPGANCLTLFIGNGNGTMLAGTTVAAGTSMQGISLADFNKDGHLDLVAPSTDGDNVNVWLGLGNGTFSAQTCYAAGDDPGSITVNDFNGDGRLDIASLSDASENVSLFFGVGDGTFSPQVCINFTYGHWINIVSSDVDNDGYEDLIATDANADRINVLLGNGNGTFKARVSYSASDPTHLSIADLNADGNDDLVVAGAGTNTVSVLLGNGNGSFKAETTYAIGNTATYTAIGDMNEDGVPDIIVGAFDLRILIANTTQSAAAEDISLLTQASALEAIGTLDTALSRINAERGAIGAFESRLQAAQNTIRVVRENYTTAESRIMDVDVAAESAELVRNTIRQQAGAAVLAQANQMPRLALSLLEG